MIQDGLSAPLHAGAIKYSKERSWVNYAILCAHLGVYINALPV